MELLLRCIAALLVIANIGQGLPVENGLRCNQPADIIFLVDTSSSIWPEHFNKHVKSFLKGIISSFQIGPGPLDTRVGILLFGTTEYLQFHLNKYQTVNDTLRAVENIRYRGGDTYTHKALEYAANYMLVPSRGSRSDVAKIVIVLTDGKSINIKKTIAGAQLVKNKGADIFAVGVGQGVDFNELNAIASTPSDQFVFQVTDFNALDSIRKSFTKTTCDVLLTTSTPKTTTTSTSTTTTMTTTTPTTTPTTTSTIATTTPTSTPTTTTTTSATTTTSTATTPKSTTRPITRRPSEWQEDQACQGEPADIYFLLDASSSVWIVHFHDQVLPFVRDLVSSFYISPLHTRIGLVTFSDSVNPEFNLSAFSDRKSLLASIQPEHVEYLTGSTNTGDAIKYVSNIGFGPDHAREGVAQVIITVTDGQSQEPTYTAEAAAAAKKKGVVMFAVGVGKEVDDKELTDISSDPDEDFVFHVDNFASLSSITEQIASKTCEAIGSDRPQTFYQCSDISSNIVFVYEYLNSVSSSKIILEYLVTKFTELASQVSSNINIGTLTQPCIGEGVPLMGIKRFQPALADVLKGYGTGYASLLAKLRDNVFHQQPSDSRKVAVLVLDQLTEDLEHIETEVNRLKAMNVEIFLVAIGDIRQEMLENMAGASHITKVEKYTDLKAVTLDVLNIACGLTF